MVAASKEDPKVPKNPKNSIFKCSQSYIPNCQCKFRRKWLWATGSSRRPSGPRRQKWALGLSPLLYSQYQLFCCTICSAITHQRSGLHRTGSSNIHTNQGPVLTAVNIGPSCCIPCNKEGASAVPVPVPYWAQPKANRSPAHPYNPYFRGAAESKDQNRLLRI